MNKSIKLFVVGAVLLVIGIVGSFISFYHSSNNYDLKIRYQTIYDTNAKSEEKFSFQVDDNKSTDESYHWNDNYYRHQQNDDNNSRHCYYYQHSYNAE
ncbi:MAG: hypothetical protein ACK5G7_00400 [Erysipelotrichaceae bacterium]